MILDFVVVSLVSTVSVIPRERSDRGNLIKPTTEEITTSLTFMCTKKNGDPRAAVTESYKQM